MWVLGLAAFQGPTQGGLTFGRLQLMPSLLKPTSRMNVWGVGIDPEVTALRISIKVQAQAVATHLAVTRSSGTSMPGDATFPLLHLSWSSLQSWDPVLAGAPSAECKTGRSYGSLLPS